MPLNDTIIIASNHDVTLLRRKTFTFTSQNITLHYATLHYIWLQYASEELSTLVHDVEELESLRLELSQYFCENETTFQLDECIKIFNTFVDMLVKASQVPFSTKNEQDIFSIIISQTYTFSGITANQTLIFVYQKQAICFLIKFQSVKSCQVLFVLKPDHVLSQT